MRYFIAIALLVLGGFAVAQWGTRGCTQPAAAWQPGSVDSNHKYEWKTMPDDPDRACLYRDGVHIGSWDYPGGYWRTWFATANQWGFVQKEAPVPPPERKPPKKDDPIVQNHGVEWDKLNEGSRITMSGQLITHDEAMDQVTGKIPDDSKKLRVLVIGPEASRKPVIDELMGAGLSERVIVWGVAADHWSLKEQTTGQAIYKTSGKPTVYCQAPDGKVLHRQDDGDKAAEAIRKAVKAYDAAKDPDLRKDVLPLPSPGPIQVPSNIVPWLLVVSGAVVFLYLRAKGRV
jgi:hypothetical protein